MSEVNLEDPRQLTLMRLLERKYRYNRRIADAERMGEPQLVQLFEMALVALQNRIDEITESLTRDPC